MPHPPELAPIDYLMVGHITADLTPNGTILGGTVSYSALTAKALGFQVGLITAMGTNVDTRHLDDMDIAGVSTDQATTFENIAGPDGRLQVIHHHAPVLDPSMVPGAWRGTPFVHIGPIAHEIGPGLVEHFSGTDIGVTPQGFLRRWDQEGRITSREWPEMEAALEQVRIVILSIHDVNADFSRIERLIDLCDIVVVTDGDDGAAVYTAGQQRHFEAPQMAEIDSVGAGDIFAAAYFCHYSRHNDPFGAGAFATHLAAHSVMRVGLDGIPTGAELEKSLRIVGTTLT